MGLRQNTARYYAGKSKQKPRETEQKDEGNNKGGGKGADSEQDSDGPDQNQPVGGGGGPPDNPGDSSSSTDGDTSEGDEDVTEEESSEDLTELFEQQLAALQAEFARYQKEKKRKKEGKRKKSKRTGPRAKGKKKKKKHPKHRRQERRKMKAELDAVPRTPEGSEEEDSTYFHDELEFLRRIQMRAYDPFDLKDVVAPVLADGDQASRDVFRPKYLEYLKTHMSKMRKRAPRDRVLPLTVAECMKPALLTYVCKYLLSKKDRSDDPSTVNYLIIHRWAMKKSDAVLAAEDNEGIKQIRAIKLALSGPTGVRNVQRAFMKLTEI